MRLIDLDAIMAQFPDADFDGDVIENMKAYPYWKIGIDGLINVLKAVPIIEQSEDCISRQQSLEALNTWDKFGYVPQYGLMRISKDDKAYIPYIHYDDAVDCIKALSSVVPQTKRGEWEDCSNGWMCSGCGSSFIHEYNFCPNCGADMRGESK